MRWKRSLPLQLQIHRPAPRRGAGMGSTAMDKKKDASSSKKSSSQKKLMLRVHIPVSSSLLFLPFGSWRGLGAGACFSLTCSTPKGRERCFLLLRSGIWGMPGWGAACATGKSSTPGVGWSMGGSPGPWHRAVRIN